MSVPAIVLLDDVIAKVGTELSITIERRVAPYFRRDQMTGGKWIGMIGTELLEIVARQVDRVTIGLVLAYQEPTPDKTAANPNPAENKTWFDARLQKIEDVKNLFRGEGQLRDSTFSGGMHFAGFENSPLYDPQLLYDKQIFQSVIVMEFAGEVEAV